MADKETEEELKKLQDKLGSFNNFLYSDEGDRRDRLARWESKARATMAPLPNPPVDFWKELGFPQGINIRGSLDSARIPKINKMGAKDLTFTPIDDKGNPLTPVAEHYIPPGAVTGSPGTKPEAPSWALPFAGQPQMSGREAVSRLAGAAGMTATGGMTGPLGAASRVGVGAGTGAIRGGRDEAIKAGIIQAILEGILPSIGVGGRLIPFVGKEFRQMLPQRPAVTDTVKNYSHSPWFGQTQQIPGPQPSPILNPAGQPARFLPAPPAPATGPVYMTEHTVTQPARAYMPNMPPFLRALLGLGINQATPLPQNGDKIPLPE